MAAVCIPPNLPLPHPDAPDALPRDPRAEAALARRLPGRSTPRPSAHDVALGVHGAPGMQLAGGSSDQLDSFTLVHVFANRSMQQMAIAKLIFDGVLEAFPRLRFGFLEAGAGWLPDLMHNLHEHWEKRVARLRPDARAERGPRSCASSRASATRTATCACCARRARCCAIFSPRRGQEASASELPGLPRRAPALLRDPLGVLARGQIFLTVEPDDPAPTYLRAALGDAGARVCGMAIDYGHWDATLRGLRRDGGRAAGPRSPSSRSVCSPATRSPSTARACALRPRRQGSRAPPDAEIPSMQTTIRSFDPLRVLSDDERRAPARRVSSASLTARDGEIDLVARTLSRRELRMQAIERTRWSGAAT